VHPLHRLGHAYAAVLSVASRKTEIDDSDEVDVTCKSEDSRSRNSWDGRLRVTRSP